jgi:hypothetical protein
MDLWGIGVMGYWNNAGMGWRPSGKFYAPSALSIHPLGRCIRLFLFFRFFPFVLDSINASVYNTHMNSSEIIKRLKKDGWVLCNVRGSHHQ